MDIQNRPPWMWRGLNASGVAGLGVRFGMLSPGPGDLIGGFRKTLGFNTKMLQFWTIWGYHHEHLSCMMLYMGKCIGEMIMKRCGSMVYQPPKKIERSKISGDMYEI